MYQSRFKQTVVRDASGFTVFVYDLQMRRLVLPLTDYALELVDKHHLGELTVTKEIGLLKQFFAYLSTNGKKLSDIDDGLLTRYREWDLVQVAGQKNSKKDESANQATVNDKLRRIYQWVLWLQNTKQLPQQTIGGVGSKVTAPELVAAEAFRQGRSFQSNRFYPLLFRLPNGASKHKTPHLLSETDLDGLNQLIMSSGEYPYTAHRNQLFVDIGATLGFRLGSINSLTTSQFSREELEQLSSSTISIRPSTQKFAYADVFEFPVWLALRVCDFIDTYRKQLIERKSISARVHKNRIFLSSRDGRPILNRSMSQEISTHMRAIGVPKGNAIHALRSKFAVDMVEQEFEARRADGGDTSTKSISQAVATKLGQKSWKSLFPYVAHAQSKNSVGIAADRSKLISQQREEIKNLKAQLLASQKRARRPQVDGSS